MNTDGQGISKAQGSDPLAPGDEVDPDGDAIANDDFSAPPHEEGTTR